MTEITMRAASLVVVLGNEAALPTIRGIRVEVWETDEPSLRGIEGRTRMKLVRDDIHARVKDLKTRMPGSH